MKEQLITFETAKLAKEKGFNKGCRYAYSNNDLFVTKDEPITIEDSIGITGRNYFYTNDIENAKENGYDSWLAPTQSLLQKWLRKKHKIMVVVKFHILEHYTEIYRYGEIEPIEFLGDSIICSEEFYEDALEAGLIKALELIDNKVKQ